MWGKIHIKNFVIFIFILIGLFLSLNLVYAENCDIGALINIKNPERILRSGRRNLAIKNLQACLIQAGYNIPAGATGYYGLQTVNAVREFYRNTMGLNLSGRAFSKQAIEQLKLILLSQNNTTTISTFTISISNNLPETTSSNISETTTTTITSTTTTTTTIGVTNRESLLNQAIECLFSQGRVKEVIDLVLNPSKLDLYLPISCNLTPSSNEGFLKAEKDTSLGDNIVLKENDTAKVLGIKLIAENSDVILKTIFLRWSGPGNPYKIIKRLSIIDEQGNILYSTDVNNVTFIQDPIWGYYLYISNLGFKIPGNGYKTIFVQIETVEKLPPGVNVARFYIKPNDLRGQDNTLTDRFAPDTTISQNFYLQPSTTSQP
jgi:hypothetical protein